jgi:hypothetical protein
MLFIDNNLLLPGARLHILNNIYRNDHRHHHKFIKYEKRLRKEGKNMSKKTQNYRYQNYCPGWQYSNLFIWPSMWTRLEHAHCLETWKILHFYSSFSLNPSKSAFFHTLILSLLLKNHMLFIGSLYTQDLCKCSFRFKGILSTKIVIFSYPKLLSFSVLTFIKWRLTPSYAAKDTIFWQKRPKTIVIRIIVLGKNYDFSRQYPFKGKLLIHNSLADAIITELFLQ